MSYIIPLLILLCIFMIYMVHEYHIRKSLLFLNGFWIYEKDNINITLYFDHDNANGKMLVSKKGLVKSDFDFTYKLNRKSDTKYFIDFSVENNYSKYAKLLSNETKYLDLYINEGKVILYNDDDTILTLIKDNQMNDMMFEYVMN